MTEGDAEGQDPQQTEDAIRRALVVSLVIGLVLVAVLGIVYWLLDEPIEEQLVIERDVTGPKPQLSDTVDTPNFEFVDITASSGIDFVHENGAYGEKLLPETMGGGVAFFDYDNDGGQDLFLVNSNHWEDNAASEPTSKLYRNLGDGTFEDVSAATGTDLSMYGMGVAVGDYDGDGFVDLFISAVGENVLLRNLGGERFVDVTNALGVAGSSEAWSTSAAFFDHDNDGDLDLYVANYVEWSPEIDRAVGYQLTGIGKAYGPPTDYGGSHSYFYRNDIELNRFVDISAVAGIEVANATTGRPAGKALAVHAADLTGDGWLDVVVANDTVRNFLFVNQRNGKFEENGIDAGIAFDSAGLATGAMGIDIANYRNNDRQAVLIGNFANEMSSFYVVQGADGIFSDDAIVAGIGAPSRRALTFGLVFLDADLDGRLDVLAANGHVEPDINKVQKSQRYEQRVQLFWNCGGACRREFRLVEQPIGRPIAGRGAAYADIDRDGDLDVIISAVGAKPMLLRNDASQKNDWIRLELVDQGNNRNAIGARIELVHGAMVQKRTVMPARSYLSQMELPVTFGLGTALGSGEAVTITVDWPGGGRETWQLEPNQQYRLVRGSAK
jgi:hypothetical protein